MTKFMGLLMLVMGIGLVAVAIQGISRGWLPIRRGIDRKHAVVSREEEPFSFWLMIIAYSVGGAVVAVFALKTIAGHGPLAIR